MGVLHILAGHSGPETAADARTHFGIFAPQVESFRVARRCISASGIITTLPQAILPQQRSRPERPRYYYPGSGLARFSVADRSTFADTDLKAAAKGLYVIRDFAPGQPRHGYVVVQGSSSTVNLVSALHAWCHSRCERQSHCRHQRRALRPATRGGRQAVLPPEARYDLMVVSTGTRRMWPIRDVGPLTDEASLTLIGTTSGSRAASNRCHC